MSLVTVGIRSVVLVVLLTLATVEARASYLFGLSEKEIDEVMTYYYPRGYDREVVLRQMSEPFDCRNFGDLCTEVGEGYAVRIVEDAWTGARKRFPIEMIDRSAEQQLEYDGQLWFDRSYPQGVPEKDPYWTGTANGTECTGTGTADSGDFRVVHTSHRHTLGFVAWGRVKVEHFKRNLLGNYELKRADKLRVEGTIFFKDSTQFDPFSFDVADEKEDAKRVAASKPYGGIIIATVPFVEGCGGVPGTALWACSCSGVQP
jgi:hypothetical protein